MAIGKVIWDAGHGGRDPGAVSPSGLKEKEFTLDIARRIARLEPGFGGKVAFHFTRLEDEDFSPEGQSFSVAADLRARSNFANAISRASDREDRIYISLHHNADASRSGKGVSVWSYPGSEQGARLARQLQAYLAPQLRPWIGVYGAGLFTANFHVLRETEMPAALIEAGFIGTQSEAEQLAKPVVRQHIAEAAVLGVASWFGVRYIFPSDNDASYERFDWNTPSGATASELEQAFAGTKMAGLGEAFLQAERESGVHAVGLAALAAWESAWGSSRIAREKNNLFGYGASDDDPYGNARPFTTREEGVLFVAGRLRRDYLSADGQFYHGANLTGMNVRYATDQNWRHGIATLWDRIRPFEQRFGPGDRGPRPQPPEEQPEPAPDPQPGPTPGDPLPPDLLPVLTDLLRQVDVPTLRTVLDRLDQLLDLLEEAANRKA